ITTTLGPNGQPVVTEIPTATACTPYGIALGPDLSLWYTGNIDNGRGRIGPVGQVTLKPPTATFTTSLTSFLPAGISTITATYSGDANYMMPTSQAVTETINKASTVTSITSSQPSSTFHQMLTFTAKVSPQVNGSPTGMVTFFDNGTSLGTGTLTSS